MLHKLVTNQSETSCCIETFLRLQALLLKTLMKPVGLNIPYSVFHILLRRPCNHGNNMCVSAFELYSKLCNYKQWQTGTGHSCKLHEPCFTDTTAKQGGGSSTPKPLVPDTICRPTFWDMPVTMIYMDLQHENLQTHVDLRDLFFSRQKEYMRPLRIWNGQKSRKQKQCF